MRQPVKGDVNEMVAEFDGDSLAMRNSTND